jgi:hypothetical protein
MISDDVAKSGCSHRSRGADRYRIYEASKEQLATKELSVSVERPILIVKARYEDKEKWRD